jgi:general secretion pathway protein D
MLCAAFAGCSSTLEESYLLDQKLESRPSQTAKQQRLRKFLADNQQQQDNEYQGFVKYGSDALTGTPSNSIYEQDEGDPEDLKLNLVNVPIASAAKAVLSDVLGLNYSVDSRVQGVVTLQTTKPLSKQALLRMFEGALRDNGAAIVGNQESYRIVPLAEASRSVARLEDGLSGQDLPGQRPQILTLKYVSADEIKAVIEPLVPAGMIVKTDPQRNAIILTGTQSEIATIRETIAVFDVDWMKGMSFALVPVTSSQPSAIVADLEQIYETKRGPLRNILRFVPNRRLKSVLVISSRAKYLKEATSWIRKLDVLASSNEETLHVYKVQNRTASALATVLQSVLRAEQTGSSDPVGEVAPKLPSQTVVSEGATEPVNGPETPEAGLGANAEAEQAAEPAAEIVSSSGSKIRVVADDANNSLLIFSTQQDFERMLSVLEEVDAQPNQVLLEAVIAEVTLDDDLKFGVRWAFGDKSSSGTFSELANGAIASSFPGFSYFLKANDIAFTLDALSSVTDVRVLSSPSLVVLDNKTATLQVGDQVPVVTQQAQGVTAGDAPIVNNVELKDTGVILNVTPRVNDSGRVILDVSQEVSDVVKTTSSGINSPTIRQRKIKTSVVVTDGEALALGGLIQERETVGKSKVPVLGDVPLLGNAFRQKTNRVSRTELIIFIRPRVIRDMHEARRITREFRRELGVQAPRVRRAEPDPGEELVRILN